MTFWPSIDIAETLFVGFKIIGYLLIAAGWVFVLSLIFNAYQMRRRRFWLANQKYTTILVQVPRNNEKLPAAAELMFASLHGIYRPKYERTREGSFQEHLSFEIVAIEKFIRFYVHLPVHLRDFVEGQIYAQYPTVEISEVDDYTEKYRPESQHFLGTELNLVRSFVYPMKTFINFEVDPLAGITAVLSKLEVDEQIWIQVIMRPVDDTWQTKSVAHVNNLKTGKLFGGNFLRFIFLGTLKLFFEIIKIAISGPTQTPQKPKEMPRLPGTVETAIKAIEQKSTKIGYEVKIRLVLVSDKNPALLRTKLQSVVGSFKQFSAANLNGFVGGKIKMDDKEFLDDYRARVFDENGYILNIEELASIYHLPNITVATPNIVWAGAKKGEPPSNLPVEDSVPEDELTLFASTDFRRAKMKFGIKSDDRKKHIYVIGKTGVGKTTMLENMAMDDMLEGRGFCFIDPHGDSIDRILDCMPENRIDDVIYFNPGDRDFPVAFNPLETVDPDLRSNVASGVVGIFKKIFGNSWGPRMEYILRYAILALLDAPDSTMLGILKILVDKKYREEVLSHVQDPVVREFWNTEFAAYTQKFATEAIAPIQNKVGQFLSTPTIRNIVAQTTSSFDMRQAMDSGKIILVKLAKGEIGEDNMTLLGGLIVTKIQQAAMSRVDVPEHERRDFYLYVDEFQNFATESFATIFSEARKYGLSLTVANQYMAQLIEEIRNAVFGNVGTIISFRVGANDAPFLAKEFAPVFEEQDLVNLNKFHIYLKLSIDGMTAPAFSAITLPQIKVDTHGNRDRVIESSRTKYANKREVVEEKIHQWSSRFESISDKPRDRETKPQESYEKPAYEKPIEPQIMIPEEYQKIFDVTGDKWYLAPSQIKEIPTPEPPKSPPQTTHSAGGVILNKNLPGGPASKPPIRQESLPRETPAQPKQDNSKFQELRPGESIKINN